MNSSDDEMPEMIITGEVRDARDREVVSEIVIPALKSLAGSLDIPVTLRASFIEGEGRVRIGDTSPFLHPERAFEGALGVADVWCYAAELLTRQVTEYIWRRWFRERADDIEHPQFRNLVSNLLKSAAGIGVRLERVRERAGTIGIEAPQSEWHHCLEEALTAPAYPRLRVFLSKQQYDEATTRREEHSSKDTWEELVSFMMDGLFTELGLVFPPLQLEVDTSLEAPWFRVEWNDLRLPPRKCIVLTELLVNDTVDRLRLMNVESREAISPANGQPHAIVPLHRRASLEAAGLTTWDMRGYLILTIAQSLRDAAGAFVTSSFTEYVLLLIEDVYPELIACVRAKLSPAALTRILRQLVGEALRIDDLPTILTALITTHSTFTADTRYEFPITEPACGAFVTPVPVRVESLSIDDYAAIARRALKRSISSVMSRKSGTVVAYIFERRIEEMLAPSGCTTPDFRRELHSAVRSEMSHLPPTAQIPVLLTCSSARARLRDALFPEYPRLRVVSHDELDPDINVQPVARISLL